MLGVWRLMLLREVSRRGTIRAAAAAMCITPSGASQQLAVLEREAGAELLERHGRRVRLTDAGELLVGHADVVVNALAVAEAELAAMRNVVSGTLRVAAFPTAARALVPPVMVVLGHIHPQLRVTLRELEAPEALQALILDEVDLAIVDEYDGATGQSEQVEATLIRTDPLYFALPPEHPLAGRSIGFADLAHDSWIMDTESSRLFEVTMRACHAAGVNPRIRSNCKDYGSIIALVEAGLGVAVLPGLAMVGMSLRASIAPTDPPIQRRILAAVRQGRRSHPAIDSALTELTRRQAEARLGRR